MKKKNDIEQELDRKEFENDLGKDLFDEYHRMEVREKLFQHKNKYVLGLMNFFTTLIFFEVSYWLLKINVNYFSLGATLDFFKVMNPFIHGAILILCIYSVIKKHSAVDVLIDRWPF